MSEQDVSSALSRVSISGVIPFPSMDSSLLRQTSNALEESSNPSPEPMLRPSASSSTLPGTIPFPSNLSISGNGSPSSRPAPVRNDSRPYSVAEESHVTSSSSRLTSSDKLSALPTSTSPNVARTTRSPTFTALANNKRGYRRSLDASTSLPFSSMGDPDSQVLGHSIWGTTPNFDSHTETNSKSGILERHPTPEKTPKQRVSFESDRSPPTMHSVGQAFLRLTRGNDPQTPSPVSRPSAEEHRDANSSFIVRDLSSPSQSPPRRHSRATSPLRMLQQWSSGLLGHRIPDEPFVPVDPFKLHYHFPFCCFPHTHTHDLETGEGSVISDAYDCDDLIPTKSIKSFFKDAQLFIIDTLPRQVYLYFLLYLPAMYFSRVARIFEDAEVSKPEIQRMIDCGGSGLGMMSTHGGNSGLPTTGTWEPNILAQSTPAHVPISTFSPPAPGVRSTGAVSGSPRRVTAPVPLPFADEWTAPLFSPALIRFRHSWEAFIDSLIREWKTLNVISALLASTILNIFQITEAVDDPVTRTAALLSLICALMSLSYGCMYIVKFGMMRNMFHASRWAEEAQKMKTSIFWNVWVLLAMPVVWMSWAMILFLCAILSFVWRNGSVSDPTDRPPLGDRAALGPRIAITCVLLLGLGYMALIITTLKKYGSQPGSTRTLANMGMGNRNAMQGGGTTIHGNTTKGQGAAASEKKVRARDIDAAMERRGRQREKSTSTTRIRRREEAVERRQEGQQLGVGDKGGRNSKGLHGLGLGSDIELKKLPEVEKDLKIDGLP